MSTSLESLLRRIEAKSRGRTGSNDALIVPIESLRKTLAPLCDALEECLEYFQDRSDVVDGDYGMPKPNTEMQMMRTVEEALGRSDNPYWTPP